MQFCKYHPLLPATYACHHCHSQLCDGCIETHQHSKKTQCFICHQEVEDLGAINSVEPFWRRLQQSFYYPMNASSLSLILAIALLMQVIDFFPFSWILFLFLVGSLLKYAFSCLSNSAKGLLIAPEINEAYGGGLGVAGRMIMMMFIFAGATYLVNQFLGASFANFFAILIGIAFPAILIVFGLTDDLLEAVNPSNVYYLITSIGLPYGLLLAFIMVMSGSVSVINQLIGEDFWLISSILQTMVSSYYLIVLFHIMGYMIFQYQKQLGFIARHNYGEETEKRSEMQLLKANIDVHIKEGFYQKAAKLYLQGIKSFPEEHHFYHQYFEMLLSTKQRELLESYAPIYFDFLVKINRQNRMLIAYKQILHVLPGYRSNSLETRLLLAQQSYQKGEFNQAIKLLNGSHKEFPVSKPMIAAYELMAECFGELPDKQQQKQKCLDFVSQLKSKKLPEDESQAVTLNKPKKQSYASIDQMFEEKQDELDDKEVEDDPRKRELPPLEFYPVKKE